MIIINVDTIQIHERQRREIDEKQLQELKTSILSDGLLHPPVVVEVGPNTYRLVAGERRLRAVKDIWKQSKIVGGFTYGRQPVPQDGIPVNLIGVKDVLDLMRIELNENVSRVDITWQEKALALEAIYQVIQEKRKAAGQPQVGSQGEVAEEFSKASDGRVSTSSAKTIVSNALLVAQNLHRPEISKARTLQEASRMLIKEGHERFSAELARRRLSKAKAAERLWDLKRLDLRDGMVELPDGSVDLILVDPPYGIDIDKMNYPHSNRHVYVDSPEYALNLCQFIIQEGWRVAKTKANMFIFTSQRLFPQLLDVCGQMGWETWKTPLIWQKSKLEGEAPWGNLGFLKTYEIFLFATKGQRGIKGPVGEIFDFPKIHGKVKTHAAEKPLGLLKHLIDISTIPNDTVLDPCAGSGSTLEAAVSSRRRVIGFELDEGHYNTAMTRMSQMENRPNDPRSEADAAFARALADDLPTL